MEEKTNNQIVSYSKRLILKVKSNYLPTLVNNYYSTNFQHTSELEMFFEQFFHNYKLTQDERVILLTMFKSVIGNV